VQEPGADVSQTLDGDTPLGIAALNGFSDLVRLLVTELGADVNQGIQDVGTPLCMAAYKGHLAVVRCLVELGAEVDAVSADGDTALLLSALSGQYSTMQYLLEEAGANMNDVNNRGDSIWDILIKLMKEPAIVFQEEKDLQALTDLLRVMVLIDDPPPALVVLLSLEQARVVQEGARLRARLPAYLVRRRALLDAHCPVLLPPLRALVHSYMELN
jgi:ankyrin repeat protein